MNKTADDSYRSGIVWDLLIQFGGVLLIIALIVAYATGEEYPHTHKLIGYAIAAVIAGNLVWVFARPRVKGPLANMTPGALLHQLKTSSGATRILAFLIALGTSLPLIALLLMALTHSIWGTTTVDEMHEVVAYFTAGLAALYVVLIGVACITALEERVHRRSQV